MGKILTYEDFTRSFNIKLGDKFTLSPFDFSKHKLKLKIEMVCKVCNKPLLISYYNALHPKNCKSCFAKIIANKRYADKWLTKEDFIKLLPKDIPYKVLTDKVNLNREVVIEGEFGLCTTLARGLIEGTLPSIVNAIDRNTYRINMYKKIHGEKFSYPEFNYTVNTATVTAVCNNCGHVNRLIDSNLLKPKAGCSNCENKIGAPAMTHEKFISRIVDLKLDIEVLETYKGYHKNILIKNKFGLCSLQPGNILKGNIGSLRVAVDKTSYMIEQFKEKHDNKYTYSNYKYCGNRCAGTITCPIHGDFEQLTDVHLMGSGCSKCGQENRVNGFGRTDFIDMANGRECTYYILECSDSKEVFYKMGITARAINKRYTSKYALPYDYKILFDYKTTDAASIWDKELEVKRNYKEFKYEPEKFFKGRTECFTLDVPLEELKNLFQNTETSK